MSWSRCDHVHSNFWQVHCHQNFGARRDGGSLSRARSGPRTLRRHQSHLSASCRRSRLRGTLSARSQTRRSIAPRAHRSIARFRRSGESAVHGDGVSWRRIAKRSPRGVARARHDDAARGDRAHSRTDRERAGLRARARHDSSRCQARQYPFHFHRRSCPQRFRYRQDRRRSGANQHHRQYDWVACLYVAGTSRQQSGGRAQ